MKSQKAFKKLFYRLFPEGLNKETIIYRINQLKDLIFAARLADTKHFDKKEALVLINTKRYKVNPDNNMNGFLTFLSKNNISYSLIAIPPSSFKTISIEKRKINLYRFNRGFLKYLLITLFKGKFQSYMKFFWIAVIKKTSPKFIFAYQPTEELCEASKSKNIKVIEIQHGAIYNYQPSTRLYKPSIFLAWDSSSLENAIKFSLAEKYIIFGYPEFYFYKKKLIKKNIKTKTILVTLSNKMFIFYSKVKEVDIKKEKSLCIPHLEKVISNQKMQNIKWIIRLHPLTSKEEIKIINRNIKLIKEQNKSIDIVLENDKSLLEQIANSDLHLTLHSSVAIKCTAFNIKSIITCPLINQNKIFKPFFQYDEIKIMGVNYSEEELLDAIINNLNDSKNKILNSNKDFSKGLLEEIRSP